ncbi:MAG: ABC transporter ATP-binding protein [Chloroflexota bacterium]|nr:ABC transporter ATP-binding protein [Chloroflexota bacterium]MDE3101398.1 ABC transporter ATP-binding protein [Chloroflexota bacterium]
MTTLVAERISAGYARRPVLADVDVSLESGQLVALVGPNGAGKSTLLRCFARLLRPSAGRVLLDGRDLASLDRGAVARRVAVVPQTFDTLFPFTVREVVALGRTARLGLLALPRPADVAAVDRAIDDLSLRDLAARRVDELSGGERQRAVLAMALAQDGDVLLLDEPTAHLDPAHQRATLVLIRRLARERGLAALAVLHDLNLAAALCDRIVVLSDGRVAADGAPVRVLGPKIVAAVFGPGLTVSTHGGTPVVLPAVPPDAV